MSTRYRATDLETVPVGRNALLAYSTTGDASFLLSMAEAQLVFLCGPPRSLEEHVAACVRSMDPGVLRHLAGSLDAGAAYGLTPPEIAIGQHLRHLVERGVLSPEGRAAAAMGAARGGAEDARSRRRTIDSVGIPTRDRPEALRRGLASHLSHARAHGRSPSFIVCDDSGTEEMRERNRDAIRSAAEGAAVRYLSRERRRAYARVLAARAGVPAATAEFALLGDPRFDGSYGAARNSLLLDTVGEHTLQVDDDTVCAPARPREGAAGLLLTARPDPSEYWFLRRAEEADGVVVEEAGVDLFAAHEMVLGRSLPGILASAAEAGEPVSWEEGSAAFSNAVADREARVLMSFAGTIGDVGGPGRHHWRMRLDGSSFERLVADEATFREKLLTRQMVRAPLRLSITNCGYCISPHLALDHTGVLPPFSPVLVAEDVSFGAALAAIHPTGCSAFLPYGVRHAPLEPRANPTALVPPSQPTNAVLQLLIAHAARSLPWTDAETALRRLGAYFSDLGGMRPAAFRNHVRMAAYATMGTNARAMEAQVALRPDAPAFWRERAEEDCRNSQRMLLQEDPAAPADLPVPAPERQGLFQDFLGRYGALLASWPELLAAARELRAEGVRPSEERP